MAAASTNDPLPPPPSREPPENEGNEGNEGNEEQEGIGEAEERCVEGPSPAFVLQLTNSQSALYSAVVSLMGIADGAQDVLQDTNAALLQKAREYKLELPFLPWAIGFARTQVMKWRKKQSRDRLILNDELFDAVAERMKTDPMPANRRLDALEQCLAELPDGSKELILSRYLRGESVQGIAGRLGRSVNTVSVSLFRIRQALLECIRTRLAAEGEA